RSRCCARGKESAGGTRTPWVAEDQRVARHARQCAHRTSLDVSAGAPCGGRTFACRGTARACAGNIEVVEGRAARSVPRLQPERKGPNYVFGILRASVAGCARVDASRLERSPRMRSG